MTSLPITPESLGQLFITALLITGSAQRAEAAVLQAIEATNLSELSVETLLERTVSVSLAGQIAHPRVNLRHPAISSLPVELRNVLNLATDCRRCFVLSVLLDLPREVTATMLQTEVCRIDELLYTAARALTFPPVGANRYESATAKS